ncbi:MAG: ABC transporter substrate-binding protein [Paracoccaceae bacterium]|nr:ABC transporter substrate-binding protein [Paracoccaceae bacterium]MDE3121726.1 ABC transporter substrate-binding protein [Paracoccaceae bacterium]MDE3239495.1 ABC transporter substrate-binding protein [Paracoccaceae bacterium]
MKLTKMTSTLALATALAVPSVAMLSAPAKAASMPRVTMMVGGIDKQIYLEYQLAKSLGMFKKYGVDMQLSTEQAGGVGAEDAMVSGQVDMAGAWYVHTIDFQQAGKDVVGIVQLAVAPGERIMCKNGSNVKQPTDWKGKSVGVTDIGSGTDDLVSYVSSRAGMTTHDYSRIAAHAGQTMIAALKYNKAVCGITSQPTVNAVEKLGVGYSAIDLSTGAGVQKWLGGDYPAANVLVRADWLKTHEKEAQGVVDALVATLHWMKTHSAADVANALPADFVSNPLTSKAEYIKALQADWGQFNLDGLGMMPANGPQTVFAIQKAAGKIKGKPVTLANTFTNKYVEAAKKLEGLN